jgi:hypothetical protein
VHRLVDGQVKHSPEVFYAGSLWKVSFLVLNLPCFCFCLHSGKSICDANLVIRSGGGFMHFDAKRRNGFSIIQKK